MKYTITLALLLPFAVFAADSDIKANETEGLNLSDGGSSNYGLGMYPWGFYSYGLTPIYERFPYGYGNFYGNYFGFGNSDGVYDSNFSETVVVPSDNNEMGCGMNRNNDGCGINRNNNGYRMNGQRHHGMHRMMHGTQGMDHESGIKSLERRPVRPNT